MASRINYTERKHIIGFVKELLSKHHCAYGKIYSDNGKIKFFIIFGRDSVPNYNKVILKQIDDFLKEHSWVSGKPAVRLYKDIRKRLYVEFKLPNKEDLDRSIWIYFTPHA